MKSRILFTLGILFVLLIVTVSFAADDGPLFTRNISQTPDTMTGAAQLSVLQLYVPAQNTQGEPPDTASGELEYYAGDCTNQDTSGCDLIYTRPEAKPLFVTYNDGIEIDDPETALIIDQPFVVAEVATGAGFGERDAFAALSLDDGATWKNYNLSDSASRSSFVLRDGHDYPGDVFKIMHAVEGNKIVVAWISRYCESGSPLYSWLDEEKTGLLAAYPELDHIVAVDGGTDEDGYQLYMDDLFSVAGSQGSVDYTLQGFPEVGEIPYGCVWTARGTLMQDLDENGLPLTNINGDPIYDIVWRAAERLTSGRRDANRIEITSAAGAGFIISWQEDPEGLRPGKGLGPGEGWSGAIANAKTDIWYTYLAMDHFDDVCLDDVEDTYCTPGTLDEFVSSELFGLKPKVAVPFAVPVRLTDNNACKGVQRFDTNGDLMDPYCYADFNENGTADFCAVSEGWTNPGGTTLEICITEDGRHLTGRTASTRVRWGLKPYTRPDGTISAWVIMAEEKMKALGTELDEEGNIIDIGKNMWYHTFDMFTPELVAQGLMLNSPAKSPENGEFFEVNVDEWGNEYYDTEIARRFNLMIQGVGDAVASPSHTSAILIYKEGILNQGGPADIFIRRVVIPEPCLVDSDTGEYIDDGTCFNPQEDNPFGYENVVCDAFDGAITPAEGEWLYTDGSNPNYVRGLCMIQGVNVSGTTIITCDDGSSGDACGIQFPFDPTYEEWSNPDQLTLPKVTEWRQCDGEAPIDGCIAGESNFDDPSWANPYDVSKGHRGFIDGDYVMMMYATAPNWNANTVGNEAYNLYIRRSFDGGQTWTTLPAEYVHYEPMNPEVVVVADGTTTCEDYGWGGQLEVETCYDYGPGDFEQARNVSRLTGSKITVLDPRYSPNGGMLKYDYTNLLCDDDLDGEWTNCGYSEAPYPEDVRDPSGFFVTYETGDNTVVTVETGAVPMDMYYSRGFNFGDDYDEQDVCAVDTEDSWYPSAGLCEEGETDIRWDWLENGEELATEASVYSNSSGDRFYAVWNQELEIAYELFTDMDVEFRRIFYNFSADLLPRASVVYISHTMADYDDTLLFVATAWDSDHLGGLPLDDIAEVQWTDTFDGVTTVVGNQKQLNMPARNLQPGWHSFQFMAKDKEGNWSPGVSFDVWIVVELHQNYIPVILKQ